MLDDPCKQLKEEHEAALNEYLEADLAASAFVSLKTVEDVEKSPPLDGDAMMKAYHQRDAAREKYEKAMNAYLECQKKLSQ